MSMKNSNDTTGNRTHDLPTCSTVPQPTEPPRNKELENKLKHKENENLEESFGSLRSAYG